EFVQAIVYSSCIGQQEIIVLRVRHKLVLLNPTKIDCTIDKVNNSPVRVNGFIDFRPNRLWVRSNAHKCWNRIGNGEPEGMKGYKNRTESQTYHNERQHKPDVRDAGRLRV